MDEIVLVGTAHVDIKGPERLRKILEIEKPDVITIECAEEYLDNIFKIKEYINKKKLMLRYGTRKIEFTPFNQSQILKLNRETLIKFFLIIYFEIIVAKEYSDKNKINLICIDKKEYIDEVSKELNKNIKKGVLLHFSMIPEDAFRLSSNYFQKLIDNCYTSKRYYNEKISKENPTKLLERNKYSVNEILKIKADKILHVGGMNHIFNNSPNMYEMLKEKGKKIRRLKLIEVDDIENKAN